MSLAIIGTTTAVVGAGASIYGASQAGKGGGPPPAPVGLFDVNPLTGQTEANKQGAGLLDYYRQNVPGFIKLQNKFGPRLMNQMFRQSNQFLNKQSELERRAALQAGRNVAAIRALELGTMREQAPLTRGLMEGLSPEQAAVVQASAQEAERARASAQGVTPEEQRMYQQAAREAAQASGRVGGSSSIAAEIMGRENVMAQKRAEAARAGQLAYSQAGEFYTTPGFNLLSNAPLGYKLGTTGAASAMAGGPAASGNFDYNMPLNLAQQSAGAQNQYNQAVYQTNLANQQAKAQMWSSIGSSMMGAGMNMGGGSYGSMLGGGLSSIGGQTGNTGLYNYGANLYNQNLGYGTAPKALIV
jgi:hypothetical protein